MNISVILFYLQWRFAPQNSHSSRIAARLPPKSCTEALGKPELKLAYVKLLWQWDEHFSAHKLVYDFPCTSQNKINLWTGDQLFNGTIVNLRQKFLAHNVCRIIKTWLNEALSSMTYLWPCSEQDFGINVQRCHPTCDFMALFIDFHNNISVIIKTNSDFRNI